MIAKSDITDAMVDLIISRYDVGIRDGRIVFDLPAIRRDQLRQRSKAALDELRKKVARLDRVSAMCAELRRVDAEVRAFEARIRTATQRPDPDLAEIRRITSDLKEAEVRLNAAIVRLNAPMRSKHLPSRRPILERRATADRKGRRP